MADRESAQEEYDRKQKEKAEANEARRQRQLNDPGVSLFADSGEKKEESAPKKSSTRTRAKKSEPASE